MIYQLTMVIVHSHVKLSECKQHQNGASLASIAVNANPKPRLSNVVSWKIPELNGGVNGKTIELNAGLCRKPCLMKPKGTGVGIPLGELVRLTFQEFVKKTFLLLLADV